MIIRPQTILLSLAFGFVLSVSAADLAPVGKVAVTPADPTPLAEAAAPAPLETATAAKAANETAGSESVAPAAAANGAGEAKPKETVAVSPAPKQSDPVISGRKLAQNASPNSFNRLLKPPSKRNLPPAKDGIHDPANDGTLILQAPKDSFDALPKANSGNRVNWVTAIENGDINPRYDRLDPDKVPIVLDLNIVREVKGSMPDVVYPHKQHTEWLDCSNCHPAIFIPMKGANNISMASILLGEKCGVCHGKVAFPVSECRKCHSKNKTE